MAFKPLKLLKGGLEIVSTILPGGGLIKGVLNLAAKKIPGAEKVLEQVFTEAESLYRDKAEIREAYLQEQESEREYLLESEGKYSELSKTEKVWRSLMRPILTCSVVGSFILILWIGVFQNIFGSVSIIHPPESLFLFAKWIIAFWFCSRGAEKLMGILKGNNAQK